MLQDFCNQMAWDGLSVPSRQGILRGVGTLWTELNCWDDLGILGIQGDSDYQKIVNKCLICFFSCTGDKNVTVEIPTPPNNQENEQPTHIYVVIGMYFMLK